MDRLSRQVLKLSEAVNKTEAIVASGRATHEEKVYTFGELCAEVENLRNQQTGKKYLTWNRAENFPELLQWIGSFPGADVSRVTIKETPDRGYGVYAADDLPCEDAKPVIRIPQAACLTPSFVSTFPIGQALSELGLPDNLKLVGILMSETANLNASSWKHYIKSLPTEFHTIMHMDSDAVRLLEGSIYVDDVLKRYCNICKHYMNTVLAVDLKIKTTSEKKKFASLFTFDLFRWALDVVMTRCNALPLPNAHEPVQVLIPLLEMINHGQVPEKFHCATDQDNNAFAELKVSRSLKAGEEILMSYQPLSVKNRLINQGFVTPDDGNLQFFIDLQSNSDESVKNSLGEYGIVVQRRRDGNFEFLGEFYSSGQATDLTIAVLRAAIALKENKLDIQSPSMPSELNLDKQVSTVIIRTAGVLLKKFPKSTDKPDLENLTISNKLESAAAQLCRDEVANEQKRLQNIVACYSQRLKSVLKLLVEDAKNQPKPTTQ